MLCKSEKMRTGQLSSARAHTQADMQVQMISALNVLIIQRTEGRKIKITKMKLHDKLNSKEALKHKPGNTKTRPLAHLTSARAHTLGHTGRRACTHT